MNREWMIHAACRGVDTNVFFPSGNGIQGRRQSERAILICRECPVYRECGEYRKATHSLYGVWAGRMYYSANGGPSDGPRERRVTA